MVSEAEVMEGAQIAADKLVKLLRLKDLREDFGDRKQLNRFRQRKLSLLFLSLPSVRKDAFYG